jgi:peptidoglycan/xylan/chitin deacetylase (PgdA/CDA1 family)
MRHQARRAISAVRRAIWPRRLGPIVLNYHRVAILSNDPWNLAVSPFHFEEHLQILRSAGRCLTVEQLVQSLHGRELPFPCFAITFDDGYMDNFTNALPLLQKYKIPATMFLVSGMLNSKEEFWWDAVDRAFLTPGQRPRELSLTVSGGWHDWYLGAAAEYSQSAYEAYSGWRATNEPPTLRHKVFLEVWEILYGAASDERSRLVQEILQWAGLDRTARADYAVMTIEQALRLGSNDLIEVGAHSVTHSPLTEISSEARRRELTGSKRQLEMLFGRRVKSFAYPHSKFDAEVADLVAQCGFDAACTSEPYNVGPNTNPRMLPRFQIGDWGGDVFAGFLKQHVVN